MKDLVAGYLGYLKTKGLSERTIEVYRKDLKVFMCYLDQIRIGRVQDIKKDHIIEYQNKIHCMNNKRTGKPVSQARKANLIISVRSMFRYLMKTGQILYNPASDIDVPRLRKERLREALKEPEMRRIIKAANEKNRVGIRDRAMLEVLYSTGMRNTELRDLKMDDIDMDNLEVIVREGKGGKGRVLPLGRVASSYVDEYLIRSRPLLLKGEDPGNLFLSTRGWQIGMSVPIDVVRKYSKKAGVNKSVCPHIIRHSCATHLIRGGADIRYVQELLGHKQLDSTRIYTKVEISDLKKVHSKTHPRERI